MFKTVPILVLVASAAIGTPAVATDFLPTSRPQVDSSIHFPEISEATRPQGAFVPPRNIAMVTNGMKKAQLYTLLDVPHFNEGLIAVHRWNYIFNLYAGKGDEYRACQYQIYFDKHYQVAGTWWRTQECAGLFNRQIDPEPVQTVVKVESVPSAVSVEAEQLKKSFDILFEFDKSRITEDGRKTVKAVSQEVSAHQYSRIVVVGFTDTMGAVSYNDALAARRAAAITAAIQHALPSDTSITSNIYSRGGRDLAVQTGADVRELRNRRVRIELY